MKKRSLLNVLAALAVFTLLPILFSGPAGAYVYDDFSGTGYGAKWTDIGPNAGLFSQPGDGYLYFNDPANGGHQDKLRSTTTFSGAFFVSLQYEFISVNNTDTTTYPFHGSSVDLFLSDALTNPNAVGVWEYNKNGTYAFHGEQILGGVIQGNGTNVVTTSVTSGWLGIEYNGLTGGAGQAILEYNDGTGWQQLATLTGLNFANDPYVLINGYDPYGNSLSFKVNEVRIDPVPIPPAIFILASGLLGLAGVRRRFKK